MHLIVILCHDLVAWLGPRASPGRQVVEYHSLGIKRGEGGTFDPGTLLV